MKRALLACLLFACLLLSLAAPALAAGGFNTPGNILIADQLNNRVIEVSRKGEIVWSFGSGDPNLCNPGPGAVIAPHSAERIGNGATLISATGTSSCPDNRVILVNAAGKIFNQYGKAGVGGNGPGELNQPAFAVLLPSGDVLITDQGNNRLLEVDNTHDILYQYGPAGGGGALDSPDSAELLANGDILIADQNNNRVLEIDPANDNKIVYRFGGGLQSVAFGSRLDNGDTLITDSGHNRLLEVNAKNKHVFEYVTNTGSGSNPNPNPSSGLRLMDGSTLIADQFNHRVIIINAKRHISFQYGTTNVAGNGPNQLNAPHSAMSIGDYTGVTPPP
jgi:hypothetical protein